MKKILKKLNGNAGLTLIEVIIGMVLMSVIMTAVSVILTPISRTIITANNTAELNNLIDNISLEIVSNLSEASAVSIVSGNEEIEIVKYNQKIIYAVNAKGLLERNGVPVWPERYYKNKTITTRYEIAGNSDAACYIVTISVYDGAKPYPIEREYAVKPLVLNPNQYI